MGLITIISTYLAAAGVRACRHNEDVVDVVVSDFNKLKGFASDTVAKVKDTAQSVKTDVTSKFDKKDETKETA